MKVVLILALAALTALAANGKRLFIHPGIWFKQDDLNRMRSMIGGNREPWTMAAIRLVASASKTQGSGAAVIQTNAYALQDSGINIVRLALAWVVTGDISYGNAARDKINDWSIYRSGGDCLRQGLGAVNLINAAEIIRFASVNGTSINWPSDEIANFENMLTTYMMPTLETLRNSGDGGWGTPAISAIASIGVFCDNATIYDKAIQLFKGGSKSVYPNATSCNGVLEMIDEKGQSYDSGRDQPHAQGLIAHLFDVAIVSWNQGTEDLFIYGNHRLLLAMEYAAKYNLNETVLTRNSMIVSGKKSGVSP